MSGRSRAHKDHERDRGRDRERIHFFKDYLQFFCNYHYEKKLGLIYFYFRNYFYMT
jgi:hypothetical protein